MSKKATWMLPICLTEIKAEPPVWNVIMMTEQRQLPILQHSSELDKMVCRTSYQLWETRMFVAIGLPTC